MISAEGFRQRYRREVEEVKHRELARANLNSLLMDVIEELASSRRLNNRMAELASQAMSLGHNVRRGARGYGPTTQKVTSRSVPLATYNPVGTASDRPSRNEDEGTPVVGDGPEADVENDLRRATVAEVLAIPPILRQATDLLDGLPTRQEQATQYVLVRVEDEDD